MRLHPPCLFSIDDDDNDDDEIYEENKRQREKVMAQRMIESQIHFKGGAPRETNRGWRLGDEVGVKWEMRKWCGGGEVGDKLERKSG